MQFDARHGPEIRSGQVTLTFSHDVGYELSPRGRAYRKHPR